MGVKIGGGTSVSRPGKSESVKFYEKKTGGRAEGLHTKGGKYARRPPRGNRRKGNRRLLSGAPFFYVSAGETPGRGRIAPLIGPRNLCAYAPADHNGRSGERIAPPYPEVPYVRYYITSLSASAEGGGKPKESRTKSFFAMISVPAERVICLRHDITLRAMICAVAHEERISYHAAARRVHIMRRQPYIMSHKRHIIRSYRLCYINPIAFDSRSVNRSPFCGGSLCASVYHRPRSIRRGGRKRGPFSLDWFKFQVYRGVRGAKRGPRGTGDGGRVSTDKRSQPNNLP